MEQFANTYHRYKYGILICTAMFFGALMALRYYNSLSPKEIEPALKMDIANIPRVAEKILSPRSFTAADIQEFVSLIDLGDPMEVIIPEHNKLEFTNQLLAILDDINLSTNWYQAVYLLSLYGESSIAAPALINFVEKNENWEAVQVEKGAQHPIIEAKLMAIGDLGFVKEPTIAEPLKRWLSSDGAKKLVDSWKGYDSATTYYETSGRLAAHVRNMAALGLVNTDKDENIHFVEDELEQIHGRIKEFADNSENFPNREFAWGNANVDDSIFYGGLQSALAIRDMYREFGGVEAFATLHMSAEEQVHLLMGKISDYEYVEK